MICQLLGEIQAETFSIQKWTRACQLPSWSCNHMTAKICALLYRTSSFFFLMVGLSTNWKKYNQALLGEIWCLCIHVCGGFPSGSAVKNMPAMQELQEMRVQSLGQEDPLEDCGNPLQYSCLENPMDRGTWQSAFHRLPKSRTQLKWLSTHARVLRE